MDVKNKLASSHNADEEEDGHVRREGVNGNEIDAQGVPNSMKQFQYPLPATEEEEEELGAEVRTPERYQTAEVLFEGTAKKKGSRREERMK